MSLRGIQPLSYSGLDDLTRFLAWSEQIKLDMSMSNPSLFRVLGEVATAKHPIAGGESFQTESGAKELREKEGRELGCLLVQRTQGEIQLKVTKWLVATNGWEAWRQLTLSFLSRLLASLLQTSFEDTPASCLQQLSAWKERVVIYQKFSGEQLSESIMMSVVMNGLTEKARHLLLLHLDGDSSFGDLEHLLATHLAEQELDNRVDYQENSSLEQEQEQDKRKLVKGGKGKGKSTKEKGGAYNPQPPAYRGKGKPQLPNSAQRACRGKPDKGKGKTNPSFKRELEHRGTKGGQNEQRKGKGEAYSPQPQNHEGDWEQQLPKKQRWCEICWKRGHTTQACWWNPSNQQQQHQQPARHSLEHQDVQASGQRRQPRVFWIDQPTACTSLIPDTLQVWSLESGTPASTQQACQSPVFMIGQQESLCNAPSLTETWGILVDTGAATSVAPQSFAQHLELSPAPPTLKLTTATGKAVKIFGLRHVHLQCQDLILRVSFVIADVVTPLLGMDMIFQHNLSLIFEHGQSFLVNKAGKRTQLQPKGEHLYLVACPFQHGLSTCSRGSLPEPIGFLPEDKELHEQTVALQSSSSTDLVEDRSFPEPLHVHDKSSFVCLLCEEKAVVSGGELSHLIVSIPCINSSHNSFPAKSNRFTSIPDLPCIDLWSFKKQNPKSLHMYCRQLVCMIFLILHGKTQLVCSEVIFYRASYQPRSLARR